MYAAILGFLTALPKLVGLFEQLIISINELSEKIWHKQHYEAAKAALTKAKQTGDTSDLEKLFNPDRAYSSHTDGQL